VYADETTRKGKTERESIAIMIGKDPKDAQRDALLRMVILDEVPLSLVESRYFR
jgi:hypothetical protein